jgi:hypothetical protein
MNGDGSHNMLRTRNGRDMPAAPSSSVHPAPDQVEALMPSRIIHSITDPETTQRFEALAADIEEQVKKRQ